MVFHRANPANFEGLGGHDYDPDAFLAQKLHADLAKLISGCCLEHSAKIADVLLTEYDLTPKPRPKYP